MIDFARLNDELLLRVHDLLPEWIPGGKFAGKEYVGTNPTRDDRHAGSFSVNVNNGKWADFATNDKGGDLSSLYAHLRKLSQAAAATELINTLGLTYCANGTASNGAGRGKPDKVWEIRDCQNNSKARHLRIDPRGDEKKRVWWEGPNGEGKLGVAPSGLPLYGAHLASQWPDDSAP